MVLLLTLSLFVLATFNLVCWYNLRTLRRIAPGEWTEEAAPFVSVIVPARNEEARIEACIRSLCQQRYPAYEVIVVDDQSEDRTPDILRQLQQEYPDRLSLVCGAPLPEGWVGKSWACFQGAQHARGEWLLFADADTQFAPTALASIMQLCQQQSMRFLSVLPAEEMVTCAERLIIPTLYVFYFGYVPEPLRRRLPNFHAASGQCFLIEGGFYHELGTHAAVAGELVEDIALGRLVAQRLGSAPVADGSAVVSCRMYENSAEAFRGFSKNTYPAMNYRWWVLLGFILHLLLLFVLPPLTALGGLIVGNAVWALLGGAGYGLGVLLRGQPTRAFRLPNSQMWLFPLAAVLLITIALNSARWSASGRLQWKGRLYRPPTPEGS